MFCALTSRFVEFPFLSCHLSSDNSPAQSYRSVGDSLEMRITLRVSFLLLALVGLTLGHPYFQTKIPNGKNVIDGKWPVTWRSEGVGHMSPGGGDARNPFGLDFKDADYTWTKELCEKDSDGDKLTNGQELGDPYCVWKPGDTPNRTHHITHPGFAEGHLPSFAADTCEDYKPDNDVITFNMTFNKYKIPSQKTTYACQRFDLPEHITNKSHHIIRFDQIIDRVDIVHHMILFSCESRPKSTEPWECGLEMPQGCKEFVWGWALGGLPECLPPEAGISVGPGAPDFFVIQMHYNNEKNVPDAIDSSGMTIHVTPHLRQFNASVFLNGAAESDIIIPAKKPAFEVVADCPSFCTQQAFPENGIFVYAYLMHMHLLGQKMWTDLIYANGTKMTLGIVPKYDFNSQTWVPIEPPLKLSRGDRLVTHCEYNSMERDRTTVGGASTDDEMCTANIAYFPRIPGFDLCTNYTDDDKVLMGRCAGFDFNWNTHEKFPICDAEDIPPQAAKLSEIIEECREGQKCTGLCRGKVLDWITSSTCVKRNNLNTTLSHCGEYQEDCDKFAQIIKDPCLDICYYDSPIGSPGRHQCAPGKTCVKGYECKSALQGKLIGIVFVVTLITVLSLVGLSIFLLTKCRRVRRKVEYVN